jgi:hypothetical protein
MDIQCNNCKSYLNIREVVTRCTECKELIKPKTDKMKATLDNFLVKWEGNSPIWKELIEWLNKDANNNLFSGDMEDRYYGRIEGKRRCPESHKLIDELINTPIISLEQWKELINKTENMNPFKEKDTVYHYKYGEGKVIQAHTLTVLVQYEKERYWHSELTLLSFAPYKLEGFTQERPFEPIIGKNYFFWNKGTLETAVVGWGMYVGKSNDELKPYIFGSLAFSFCSDKNPLL